MEQDTIGTNMRYSDFVTAVVICAAIGIAGCNRVESETTAQTSGLGQSNSGNETNASAKMQAAKDGWKLYSPPEKDFSVMAPEKVEAAVREDLGKFREYVFRKGEAYITVTIHTDRKEPLAGNSVEELKSSEDILPGSLEDISLGDMPGIEFRTHGRIGESIFREYCASDNSKTISIQVAKDYGGGFSEDEIRLFLDSFKLLP
ncbi:MAG: hypothetical protein AB8B91_08580 [Rubripirellula sp.]